MRRLLTLKQISQKDYQTHRDNQQEMYKDSPVSINVVVPYHNRLLNASGENFARTAVIAYYEQKITLAELASVFSNCDTKHLFEIENTIFA